MSIKCSRGVAHYRFKKGTHVRLAFCGKKVVEAKRVVPSAYKTVEKAMRK